MNKDAAILVIDSNKSHGELLIRELSDVGALVKFDISGKEGGEWIVDLNNESLGVRIGDEEANCTFTASDDNFVKLIRREIKPETAILTGKVKISGDFMRSMQLSKLFKE